MLYYLRHVVRLGRKGKAAVINAKQRRTHISTCLHLCFWRSGVGGGGSNLFSQGGVGDESGNPI